MPTNADSGLAQVCADTSVARTPETTLSAKTRGTRGESIIEAAPEEDVIGCFDIGKAQRHFARLKRREAIERSERDILRPEQRSVVEIVDLDRRWVGEVCVLPDADPAVGARTDTDLEREAIAVLYDPGDPDH